MQAPHDFDAATFTRREVESEICFRLAADLRSGGTAETPVDTTARYLKKAAPAAVAVTITEFATPASRLLRNQRITGVWLLVSSSGR